MAEPVSAHFPMGFDVSFAFGPIPGQQQNGPVCIIHMFDAPPVPGMAPVRIGSFALVPTSARVLAHRLFESAAGAETQQLRAQLQDVSGRLETMEKLIAAGEYGPLASILAGIRERAELPPDPNAPPQQAGG